MLEAEERANQGREDNDEEEADACDDYLFHGRLLEILANLFNLRGVCDDKPGFCAFLLTVSCNFVIFVFPLVLII